VTSLTLGAWPQAAAGLLRYGPILLFARRRPRRVRYAIDGVSGEGGEKRSGDEAGREYPGCSEARPIDEEIQ
jgi:hypothetical protein